MSNFEKIGNWLKELGKFVFENPTKGLALILIGFILGSLHNWLGL